MKSNPADHYNEWENVHLIYRGETMAQLQPIVDIPVNFSGKSKGLPLVLIERL